MLAFPGNSFKIAYKPIGVVQYFPSSLSFVMYSYTVASNVCFLFFSSLRLEPERSVPQEYLLDKGYQRGFSFLNRN